jgi:tetrahydrodipicolinate N-succinyltransferase
MANYNIQVNSSTASEPVAINASRVRIASTVDVYCGIGDSSVVATDQDLIVLAVNVEENVLIGPNNYVSFLSLNGTGVVSVTELIGQDTSGFYRDTPPAA